jgi:hypothetical protein
VIDTRTLAPRPALPFGAGERRSGDCTRCGCTSRLFLARSPVSEQAAWVCPRCEKQWRRERRRYERRGT